MSQSTEDSTATFLKSKAAFILVVALAFFVFELYLLLNSFSADYRILTRVAEGGFTFWGTYWLTGELVGEVALILRFSGACFFLAFAALLLRRGEFAVGVLRKGVFLEAVQYFFFIPFISYLYLHPYVSAEAAAVSYLAASSYVIQLLIVTPLFLTLYLKLKTPNARPSMIRWAAVAAVGFLLALWAKHFIFSLYALPVHFSFENTLLLLGSLNSTFTLLVAAIVLLWH